MKRAATAVSLFAVAVAMLMWTSCATSPERTAYQSINASGELANAALRSWSAYCKEVEGTPARVPLDKHLEVKAVWDKYQTAMESARAAVRAYKQATEQWEKGGKQGEAPAITAINVLVNTLYSFSTEFATIVQRMKGGSL